MKITDYRPDPKNANRGTERGRAALRHSLETYGAGRSILLARDGTILAGNKTAEAAGELGIEDVIEVETDGSRLVAVRRTDLDPDSEEARLIALADNRVGSLDLDWDPAAIDEALKDGLDLSALWTGDELEELLKGLEPAGGLLPGADVDAIPEKVDPRVKSGETWQLGRHRLLCGDSTDQRAVGDLLGMVRPALGFADPPYGAKVDEWDETFVWDHDYLAEACEIVAVTPGTNSIQRLMQRTQMPYVWSLATWISNGFARGAVGFSNWLYTALFSHGSVYQQAQDFVKIDLVVGEADGHHHRGQKPPRYMSWLFELLTRPGDCVLDVFAGSGTSYVAAEQTGRTCVGVEINSAFCDVILTRWESATGEQARRL